MSTGHFDINRPVHLARRDIFFERAVELLYAPTRNLDTVLRLQHVEHVLSLLQTADQHAFFGLRSSKATTDEENFLHFLKLVTDNVRSVHAMMGHQLQLESGGGFMGEFLGVGSEESVLPALHYQRRAEDIMQGLWHVLRLAQIPYRSLSDGNQAGFSDEEKSRYEKAAESFRGEVQKKYTVPPSESPSPVPQAH